MGIPANVGIVAGGIVTAGVAGAVGYGGTVATTNVGDWAHPVAYADATGRTGTVAGAVGGTLVIGGLVAASKGAIAHGKSIAAATSIFTKPAAQQMQMVAETKAALEGAQKIGASRLALGGVAAALAGVAIYAGFNAGVQKTHERMEKPVFTLKSDVTVRHTVNGVKTVQENVGSFLDGLFGGGSKDKG